MNNSRYVYYNSTFEKSLCINTQLCAAVSLFDENDFRQFIKSNNINIEYGLTETTISTILDKWPSFFDGMKIEIVKSGIKYFEC